MREKSDLLKNYFIISSKIQLLFFLFWQNIYHRWSGLASNLEKENLEEDQRQSLYFDKTREGWERISE
jgi:hypothetical protein